MRILGFGTYDTARHPRVGIVLDGFRARGDEVFEANAPLGFSTGERVDMVHRPWRSWSVAPRLARNWVTIARRARGARSPEPWDAVVVGYLGHFDVVLARLLFPRRIVVLDLLIFAADTARDRGVTSSTRLRLLGLLDSLAVRCADLVMVDTEEHLGLLAPGQRHKGVVVPVGAPTAWHHAGSVHPAGDGDAGADGPLRVVFFGLFTPLQGSTVIGEALGSLADGTDLEATMIGDGQDAGAARALAGGNPRITWVGWVDHDELPAVVADHHLCLGIFGTSPKALRVVPNKIYQGAAAGCALVTSDTPPQRRALGEDAVFVPAGDAGALARALRELAADRPRLAALRAGARQRAADRFAPVTVVAPLRARLAGRRTPD